jgi:hypothetical protein
VQRLHVLERSFVGLVSDKIGFAKGEQLLVHRVGLEFFNLFGRERSVEWAKEVEKVPVATVVGGISPQTGRHIWAKNESELVHFEIFKVVFILLKKVFSFYFIKGATDF